MDLLETASMEPEQPWGRRSRVSSLDLGSKCWEYAQLNRHTMSDLILAIHERREWFVPVFPLCELWQSRWSI